MINKPYELKFSFNRYSDYIYIYINIIEIKLYTIEKHINILVLKSGLKKHSELNILILKFASNF